MTPGPELGFGTGSGFRTRVGVVRIGFQNWGLGRIEFQNREAGVGFGDVGRGRVSRSGRVSRQGRVSGQGLGSRLGFETWVNVGFRDESSGRVSKPGSRSSLEVGLGSCFRLGVGVEFWNGSGFWERGWFGFQNESPVQVSGRRRGRGWVSGRVSGSASTDV
ncbi:hypothetical protein TIFTF001_015190 [Ficus carica]|uniref:Uncharacterized protein n=1 Tax=Ficus carica TaxID=3494 RepID=A0AA88A7D2_FICCA|nr:hypothetical protein TIFTF001_015190 [Ficus carica]